MIEVLPEVDRAMNGILPEALGGISEVRQDDDRAINGLRADGERIGDRAEAERENTDLVGAGRGADSERTNLALEESDLPNILRFDSERTKVVFKESDLITGKPLPIRVNGELREEVRDRLKEEMVEDESTDFKDECSMGACGLDLLRSRNSCSHRRS